MSVSRTPGHTKYFQTYYLTKTVKLCDCPGLVFPSYVAKQLQVEPLSRACAFLCLAFVCTGSHCGGGRFLLFLDLVRHLPAGPGAGALQLSGLPVRKAPLPLCAQAPAPQLRGGPPGHAAAPGAGLDGLGRVRGWVGSSPSASDRCLSGSSVGFSVVSLSETSSQQKATLRLCGRRHFFSGLTVKPGLCRSLAIKSALLRVFSSLGGEERL